MIAYKEISSDPHYKNEASLYSKAIISLFFTTYLILLLVSESSPSLFEVIIFSIIGMFVISILIASPFFILGKMFPSIGIIFPIVGTLVSILITIWIYSWAF